MKLRSLLIKTIIVSTLCVDHFLLSWDHIYQYHYLFMQASYWIFFCDICMFMWVSFGCWLPRMGTIWKVMNCEHWLFRGDHINWKQYLLLWDNIGDFCCSEIIYCKEFIPKFECSTFCRHWIKWWIFKECLKHVLLNLLSIWLLRHCRTTLITKSCSVP